MLEPIAIHSLSPMSLIATALVLIGAFLGIRALYLLVPDVEPDGTSREYHLRRKGKGG
jgi:hypothetical protein